METSIGKPPNAASLVGARCHLTGPCDNTLYLPQSPILCCGVFMKNFKKNKITHNVQKMQYKVLKRIVETKRNVETKTKNKCENKTLNQNLNKSLSVLAKVPGRSLAPGPRLCVLGVGSRAQASWHKIMGVTLGSRLQGMGSCRE